MNVYAEAITLSCVYIRVLELVYCDSKYNKYERPFYRVNSKRYINCR